MQKEFVTNLRKNQTIFENKIWNSLRGRRFLDFKFRRQRPIGPYIVDFVCFKKKIIIELDGSQHQEQQNYDLERTKYLESQGFKVLRFWNNQIAYEYENVLAAIYLALK